MIIRTHHTSQNSVTSQKQQPHTPQTHSPQGSVTRPPGRSHTPQVRSHDQHRSLTLLRAVSHDQHRSLTLLRTVSHVHHYSLTLPTIVSPAHQGRVTLPWTVLYVYHDSQSPQAVSHTQRDILTLSSGQYHIITTTVSHSPGQCHISPRTV